MGNPTVHHLGTTHTHTCAHMNTHTSVLVLIITTAKTGDEPAGGNKTVNHIATLAVERPALSITMFTLTRFGSVSYQFRNGYKM